MTQTPESALEAGRAAGAACLAAALEYLALGWSPLCLCPPDHVGVGAAHARECKTPGKVPLGPWKQYEGAPPSAGDLRDKWRANQLCNVGLALGPVSGLVGVDVEGPAGEARLAELSGGDLPPTLEFTTGEGRRLLYAIPAGAELRTTYSRAGKGHQEVRFQAKGAQTVMPPSRHRSGRRYEWVAGRSPSEARAAPAPAWLLAALRPPTGGRPAAPAAGGVIGDGARNSTLTSLAGTVRRRGGTEAEILALLRAVNEARCDPPLEDAEVAKIARSVAGYASVTGNGSGSGNGSGAPAPQPADRPDNSEMLAKDVILEHWRAAYQPTFRRGDRVYSAALGREVRRGEALTAAGSGLIAQLAHALDAPRDDSGAARLAKLPALFRTWAPTAWVDLFASLPEEESTAEVPDAAEQEFRDTVLAALLTHVTLGRVMEREGRRQTQAQRRTLFDWCRQFARSERWADVRGYCLWCRRRQGTLEIAVSKGLFAQLPGFAASAAWSATRFTRLCKLYGVGDDERARGRRVVVLSAAVTALLAERPADDTLTDTGPPTETPRSAS